MLLHSQNQDIYAEDSFLMTELPIYLIQPPKEQPHTNLSDPVTDVHSVHLVPAYLPYQSVKNMFQELEKWLIS